MGAAASAQAAGRPRDGNELSDTSTNLASSRARRNKPPPHDRAAFHVGETAKWEVGSGGGTRTLRHTDYDEFLLPAIEVMIGISIGLLFSHNQRRLLSLRKRTSCGFAGTSAKCQQR